MYMYVHVRLFKMLWIVATMTFMLHVYCTLFFRQKTTILKQQQDIHELEAKLHHMMVAQVREHGGPALEARLQVQCVHYNM